LSTAAIEPFLAILEKGPSSLPCVFNPWRDHDERDRAPTRETPRIRRDNMAAYLEARRTHARVMLLGEAPSHRGCRFTGIAFCSETELVHKRDLVARRALVLTSRDAKAKPQRERSAAVIWNEIEAAGRPFEILLWNAFPWHPYRAEEGEAAAGPCGPSSNRKPRRTEVAEGRRAFEALLKCFTHEIEVFAIGKVAEEALDRWDARCAGYIRHPAQGGEALFRAGFRSQVASRL
jgi:hypothetical protein